MNTIVTDFPPRTKYELRDPTGVKESEFQETVIRVMSHLYPDCKIFRFYPNVRYNDAIWQPDLAVVDRGLRFWFVIEVEIATHHLEKHVLPQVTAFNEGIYEGNAAQQLANGLGISEEQARTVLLMIPRDVVVISNRFDERWTRKLLSVGVQMISVSEYRNPTTAQRVHRIDGELIPSLRSVGFGRVRADDSVIVTQDNGFWKDGVFDIFGPEGMGRWICSVLDGRVWLMKSKGVIEFHNRALVQFLLRNDGSLAVRLPYPM